MALTEVYPNGQLAWAGSTPCDFSRGFYTPTPGALPALSGEVRTLCFLNEVRVRNGKYNILHYKISDYHDDGPPALDQLVEACRLIEEALKTGQQVVVYCPDGQPHFSQRCFSALCVAAHRILVRGEGAKAAAAPWMSSQPSAQDLGFFAYSWASRAKGSPPRTLAFETCLEALELACGRGWLDFASFDSKKYWDLWKMYDLSVIVPGDILVLGDPMSTIIDPDPSTVSLLVPKNGDSQELSFASLFDQEGVKLLVRLNLASEPGLKRSYDPAVFTKRGMAFTDASYDDVNGGVPPASNIKKIVAKCRELSEADAKGAAAFHCKAGFGRSVACAAVWMAYKHDIPGGVAFAWSRMCRPGSITTPQQAKFLQGLAGRDDIEEKLLKPPACCILQ